MTLQEQVAEYKKLLAKVNVTESNLRKRKAVLFKRFEIADLSAFERNVAMAEFDKKYTEPARNGIRDIKQKVLDMEKEFNFEVNLGDLVDEIQKITKIPSKKLIVDIEEIPFYWGERNNTNQVENFIKHWQMKSPLNISIFHSDFCKSYSNSPLKTLCFYKESLLTSSTRFKQGTLKDNITRTNTGFKITDPRNVFVKFNLKDFANERDDWQPVNVMEKALTNTLEKNHNKKNVIK